MKHDPDARAANLRESLSPEAVGISPDVQKQLILELLDAATDRGGSERHCLRRCAEVEALGHFHETTKRIQ